MSDHEKIIIGVLGFLVLLLVVVTATNRRMLNDLQDGIGSMSEQQIVDVGQNDSAYKQLAKQKSDLLELFERIEVFEGLWDNKRLEELNRLAKQNEADIRWQLGIISNLNETNIKQSKELGSYHLILCGRTNSIDEGLVYEVTGLNCRGRTIDEEYCLTQAIRYGDGDPQRYEFYEECVESIVPQED